MAEFTVQEKNILERYFTNTNKEDTVYAAKQELPQEIVGYIIGRASRAKDTFREIFLQLWQESGGEDPYNAIIDPDKDILNKISEKSINFMKRLKTHNSLRDVPHVAVFCDELSILLTKVWEHEVVAEYQEKSTRYRPFIASNVFIPNGISEELKNDIVKGHENLINVYNKIYESTGKRDLARYLLPVGSKTAMGCMASIRSWERIVARLYAYPTKESYKLANMIENSIKVVYSGFYISDKIVNKYKEEFSFIKKNMIEYDYDRTSSSEFQLASVEKMNGSEVYKIVGMIDIGAHRDLQRHRSVIQNFPNYLPVNGYDILIGKYISEDLYQDYVKCMQDSNLLFWRTYDELKDSENIGEIQYLALLGNMTRFWYITDKERWEYIYNLRTGDPSQESTNASTVHFSYSSWCKKADKFINMVDEQEKNGQ